MLAETLEGARPRPGADALDAIAAALDRGRRFLVVMHEFPDGDSLGSSLALARALEERGREALVYSPQGAPRHLRFLPGAGRIATTVAARDRFDVCIACDSADPARLGPQLPEAGRRGLFVNLDHHASTAPYGDLNLLDPGAAAVGVLVHRVLGRLGHPISPEVAVCLWVSLHTDTGGFRHASTDAECLAIAGELVQRGVRPGEVTSRLYDSQPVERVRLLADVLSTLEVAPCGRIAWVVARRAQFQRAGTDEETVEGFVSYPRSIAGVEVALLFREDSAQRTRVSLRSRGGVDVGAVALRLGGGGHRCASGCVLDEALEPSRLRVLSEVSRAVERSFA